VEDPSLQVELRTVLSRAIDELPAGYRAVLVLRDVEDARMARSPPCWDSIPRS